MLLDMWKKQLTQTLNPAVRACIVGVGSELRGDDSAGMQVSRTLRARFRGNDHILVLDGGPAPENITGKIRKFHPEWVVFVDAAHLDETPGTIGWIPVEAIDGMSASSHSLPLSLLAQFLKQDLGCQIAVLGIQPGQNELGEELSPGVEEAVNEVTQEIEKLFLVPVV